MLVPDPDLFRRFDIILPEGWTTTFGTELALTAEFFLERWLSVGVGGVLTITGAAGSIEGGVRGRPEVSMDGG